MDLFLSNAYAYAAAGAQRNSLHWYAHWVKSKKGRMADCLKKNRSATNKVNEVCTGPVVPIMIRPRIYLVKTSPLPRSNVARICFLLFTFLYITSYLIITRFKKRTDFILGELLVKADHGCRDSARGSSVERPSGGIFDQNYDEDAMVNRIALWMCTFTLAVSLAAALLLPFSIVSNEVLLSFPHSYYMQWLNGSLVHGLWNLVFLCSNLSLVLLMPFAYFFIESEGFTGSRKGVMGRVYEAAVVLCLLVLLVFGMVWVASSIIDKDPASTKSLRGLWDFYLPYLYSCISLFGVLLLLVCTPLGLSRMFGVTGQLLVKPRLLENLDEQIECSRLEEAVLKRRLKAAYGSLMSPYEAGAWHYLLRYDRPTMPPVRVCRQ
ncbi:protein LMBR1L-like [Callorhinchus milii]|uniref:protein LMBR1L-like n=1 Tax=Callorhinchus milii TaxID=7868 RepID=UPI001C3FB960|nr:protein LMBR1L-like [Callorhinchus milii]